MSSLQGRLFGSLREEERVLEDRRNYLSHGMGGSVDELLQFVAHCCGREVAACVCGVARGCWGRGRGLVWPDDKVALLTPKRRSS